MLDPRLHTVAGEPPHTIRNMACVRALIAAEKAPLGDGAFEGIYSINGAPEPYTGGFSPAPKPREATPPPSDQFADPAPDPETEYAPDDDFGDTNA